MGDVTDSKVASMMYQNSVFKPTASAGEWPCAWMMTVTHVHFFSSSLLHHSLCWYNIHHTVVMR